MNTKKNKKIAFYVSGKGTRLIKIIEQYPTIIDSTVLVINDDAPNPILAKLLIKKGVTYIEFNYKEQHQKGAQKNSYISNLLLEKFRYYNITYCFCFGGKILKGELLKSYEHRIINFHPSLLPSFPGIKAIDQALSAGAFLLGNTAHFIDEGTDTGPIIMQSSISSSSFSSYDDVLDLQLPMINQIFRWIIEDRLKVEKNKVIIRDADYSKPSFYPKIEINK